jgi:AcrR family transcriptional regulator
MKVSREKKQEHYERFIDAFVGEVRGRGYAAVTLRDVARAAGLSDGAIYKYFASKEKILLAYYAAKMDRLRLEGGSLLEKPYTLVERLQALLEFQIGQYEEEKDFLEKTFHPTFVAASLMWAEVAGLRKAYLGTVRAFLESAQDGEEIPGIAFPGIVDEMLWCHYIGVMLYWLKDESEFHEDTTQFIDRTLNLFAAVVGSPLLRQAEELLGFLINRHLMPKLLDLGGLGKGMKAGLDIAGTLYRKASGTEGRGERSERGSAGSGRGTGADGAERRARKGPQRAVDSGTGNAYKGPRKPGARAGGAGGRGMSGKTGRRGKA